MAKTTDDLSVYLSGEKLYGDDFGREQLAEWYRDEAEGYAEIGDVDRQAYRYGYHALNAAMFFRYLPKRRFEHVLGFGSAYGEELAPIAEHLGKITVVEPSSHFPGDNLHGVPMVYVKPRIDGHLEYPDGTFDLVMCASALHHVANVSTVVTEFARCVKPGGFVLIREPTVSMGNWQRSRRGLTKRERGIPLAAFEEIIAATKLQVLSKRRCMFRMTKYFGRVLRGPVFNSRMAVQLDAVLSWLFSWNRWYNPSSRWQKLQPAAIAYVLQRRCA